MLNTRVENSYVIVEMPENIDLYNAAEIKKTLFPLSEENDFIAIDFEKVKVIDSSGLGVLAVLSKQMALENKSFALFNIPNNIFQIMKITSADKYFSIYNSFEEIQRS
ncbi:MAG: STAS domain-containing protein [Spirochaetes bacterium]|nr:STAS domain-containing protein [Spirochaetota bacterium]MBN2770869.1 STAS domain-containing protein [Spirochaetota bacterium]